MKTSKPFSTVSFNSPVFLTKKLMEFEKKRKILFWCYIIHDPEEDEKKRHIHVFCVPNGKVDTDQFIDELEEIDPNNKIPLKSLPCNSSKFDDFYLYNLHDSNYLASKGQSRKLHYKKEDFAVSSEEQFSEMIHHVDYSKLNGAKVSMIKGYVEKKIPFYALVASGVVPIQQIKGWEMTYKLIWDSMYVVERTERGEKGQSHE